MIEKKKSNQGKGVVGGWVVVGKKRGLLLLCENQAKA